MTDHSDIKIGVRGRIIEGEDAGSTILIEKEKSSLGLLILVAQETEDGYDAWVKDEGQLAGYFAEAGWRVEWEDG